MIIGYALRKLHILDSGLCSSQTCDGNAEGAAGDVVKTGLVAELNGAGVAAVLAADTQLKVLAGGALTGMCPEIFNNLETVKEHSRKF